MKAFSGTLELWLTGDKCNEYAEALIII